MFFMLLLAAGTHSTRITLGNGLLCLMDNPSEHARLKNEPTLIDSAIEEILRFCPPILHFRRTASRDVTVRGQHISTGQKVVVWYASANRDDDVFEPTGNHEECKYGRNAKCGINRRVPYSHGKPAPCGHDTMVGCLAMVREPMRGGADHIGISGWMVVKLLLFHMKQLR